jgi:hypothetical protein
MLRLPARGGRSSARCRGLLWRKSPSSKHGGDAGVGRSPATTPRGLTVDGDDVGRAVAQRLDPVGKAGLEQFRIEPVDYIVERVVGRQAPLVGQEAPQEVEDNTEMGTGDRGTARQKAGSGAQGSRARGREGAAGRGCEGRSRRTSVQKVPPGRPATGGRVPGSSRATW